MKIYIKTFTGNAKTYNFDVEPSATVGQLKDMFCEKANTKEDLPILCLIINRVNREELEEDDKTLEEYKVPDDSILDAIFLGKIYRADLGFMGSRFIDFTSGKGPKRIEWSSKAPSWRRSIQGLCLEGKCPTSGCPASGHYVIMRIGYKKFNILEDAGATTTVCPMCKKYVEPRTCAFNNCWWRYEGIKNSQAEDGAAPERVSSEWFSADDAYHRFEEEASGVVMWRRLVVEAVKEKP